MNKIQRNAKAYNDLIDMEYIFFLGYKGKCKKVILRFNKENFHHLEGFGQLSDIMLHSIPANKSFELALEGKIDEGELRKSEKYVLSHVDNKINYLYLLEEVLDNNDIVFNYMKCKTKGSKIQAKIFLYKDMSGKDIYLFLDSSNNDEYYFPRSFVVAPDLDYKQGQYKYTVLWKEKRNIQTGESKVLFRFKDFTPENAGNQR